jgi:hypothetical protein
MLELGATLWIAGMIGVASMLRIIPQLAASSKKKTKLSPGALIAISFLQGALLLALAVWAGIALAPRTGLHAALLPNLLAGKSIRAALAPVMISGLIGGVVGGAIVMGAGAYARRHAPAPTQPFDPPLSARLLYGGITEELLLRWGVMSALAWLGARMLAAPQTPPAAMWSAIVASAVLFGIGHLPAARGIFGRLTAAVIAYVVIANSAFGVMAGFLFWRYGIESAILAHAGAHALAAAFGKKPWPQPAT